MADKLNIDFVENPTVDFQSLYTVGSRYSTAEISGEEDWNKYFMYPYSKGNVKCSGYQATANVYCTFPWMYNLTRNNFVRFKDDTVLELSPWHVAKTIPEFNFTNVSNVKYPNDNYCFGVIEPGTVVYARHPVIKFDVPDLNVYPDVYNQTAPIPKIINTSTTESEIFYIVLDRDKELFLFTNTFTHFYPDYFKEGVLPKRILIEIQAAGGGGAGGEDLWDAQSGGGGGSGSYGMYILNTDFNSNYRYNVWRITLGHRGAGGSKGQKDAKERWGKDADPCTIDFGYGETVDFKNFTYTNVATLYGGDGGVYNVGGGGGYHFFSGQNCWKVYHSGPQGDEGKDEWGLKGGNENESTDTYPEYKYYTYWPSIYYDSEDYGNRLNLGNMVYRGGTATTQSWDKKGIGAPSMLSNANGRYGSGGNGGSCAKYPHTSAENGNDGGSAIAIIHLNKETA